MIKFFFLYEMFILRTHLMIKKSAEVISRNCEKEIIFSKWNILVESE